MPRLLLALSALALAGGGCGDATPPAGEPRAAAADGPAAVTDLLGTWQLDPVTREWLPRACVRLAFPDAPTFDVRRDGDDLVVQLHTRDRLTWRARGVRSPFRARQIIPTTESGRFCGSETPVRLTLRASGPDVLRGVWQTPGCDVCPDRPFGAVRARSGVAGE